MADMIKPAWSPTTDAQRAALLEAELLAMKAREAEQAMWAAIVQARDLGIPDEMLCRKTGQSRATLNRRYGTRSNPRGVAAE